MNNELNNIDRALDLYDAGKSVPKILSMFPEERKELQEIFSTIGSLKQISNNLTPSPTLLHRILLKLPAKHRGTISLLRKIVALTGRFKILLLPLASAAVIVIIFVGQSFVRLRSQAYSANEISQQVLDDSADEQLIINDSDNDIQLVKNDSAITDQFSNIIDEYEY